LKKLFLILSYLDFPFYAGLSKRIEALINVLSLSNVTLTTLISPIFRLDKPLPYKNNNFIHIRIDLRKLRKIPAYTTIAKLVALIFFSFISLSYIMKLRKSLTVIQYESIYSFIPALIANLLFKIKVLGDDIGFPIKKTFVYRVIEALTLKYTHYIIVTNLNCILI
jgi:hypothetical protein